jgi:hypothetical protein
MPEVYPGSPSGEKPAPRRRNLSDERRAAIRAFNAATKRKYPDDGFGLYSRLFNIWHRMKLRCSNTKHRQYDRYGGRGITVCQEWFDDYLAFKAWSLANGYAETLSIDRINNDLGYFPENCRWTTMQVQQTNRSDNIPLTAWGETKTIGEWARDPRCSVGKTSLYRRFREGLSAEEAIAAPKRKKGQRGSNLSSS